MNINKVLLVGLLAVSTAFSTVKYDNASECAQQEAIKGAVSFVVSVATTKVNDAWKTETPLDKIQLKNEQAKIKLTEEQTKHEKSQTFAQKFDTHLKNCGKGDLHFDQKTNKYKDTPCGRFWEKWAALLEKDTEDLYAEYNGATGDKKAE